MNKTIIIRLSILFTLLFGFGMKCFAAYDLHEMDDTYYPVWYIGSWKLIMKQVDNGNGSTPPTYAALPFVCKIKTDYPGTGGVKARLDAIVGGNHEYFIVTKDKEVTLNEDIFSRYGAPFKQPTANFINYGCSKYLDGDVCNNRDGYKPMIYVSCKYK